MLHLLNHPCLQKTYLSDKQISMVHLGNQNMTMYHGMFSS